MTSVSFLPASGAGNAIYYWPPGVYTFQEGGTYIWPNASSPDQLPHVIEDEYDITDCCGTGFATVGSFLAPASPTDLSLAWIETILGWNFFEFPSDFYAVDDNGNIFLNRDCKFTPATNIASGGGSMGNVISCDSSGNISIVSVTISYNPIQPPGPGFDLSLYKKPKLDKPLPFSTDDIIKDNHIIVDGKKYEIPPISLKVTKE